MTDPEFIVSFLNSGCSKFFYTSSLELDFSDSQISKFSGASSVFGYGLHLLIFVHRYWEFKLFLDWCFEDGDYLLLVLSIFFPLLFSCIISLMYIDIHCIILLYRILYQSCKSMYYSFIPLCYLLNVVISSGDLDLNGRIYGIRVRCKV